MNNRSKNLSCRTPMSILAQTSLYLIHSLDDLLHDAEYRIPDLFSLLPELLHVDVLYLALFIDLVRSFGRNDA